MPLEMLLRSFFIATISSKKYLLIPSLKLLSFFAKPGRSYLFNVDRNPVLHGLLKKTFYNQFCAGESKQETQACCKSLTNLGFKGVILTYAKELVFDHNSNVPSVHAEPAAKAEPIAAHDPVIEEWRVGTLATVDMINKGDVLALKTTGGGAAVGAAFHRGELPPPQMMEALDEIATRCKDRGIQIIVDAESQYFQKGIARTSLELMRKFNRDPTVVIYNTYQAYLKHQPKYIQQHLAEAEKDGFTLGLKLVRGAYILSDDRALIHDTKEDTDAAYNGIVEGALHQKLWDFGVSRPFPALNLFLASHNKESVITAQRLHAQREKDGMPTVPVAFAQLHGMSDEVGFSLLQERGVDGKAPDVFKCSTWGNLGTAILKSLIEAPKDAGLPFTHYIACVHSAASEERLAQRFPSETASRTLVVSRGANAHAISAASVVILGVDPTDVSATLQDAAVASALKAKLLISIAAGWSRTTLERVLSAAQGAPAPEERTWILRALPNVAAQVSQSLTALEDPDPHTPAHHVNTCTAIFTQLGRTVQLAPKLMGPASAVGGSTPAFWAIICDAFVDASVAVGVPRKAAQDMIYQSMAGSAALLQSGVQPGELRDMGTSPEGCTIGGIMVMEEMGVRGALGKALREAVTLARLMGAEREGLHVNDTRENTGRL
ncbi:pyrroline-5-carboxylate reductase [Karstenula rhodostoma CBS 690.94]|uniref:Proline dehydrogenase n=1 Tax=Karstenula rhodostoma CBS 690.94 TaxID=1392251 RepID=A0A9P4UET9_9PLEO|nr:pyrroline-5-carboxylate reductase [Karstenula rhodostoma CBS 690.94]